MELKLEAPSKPKQKPVSKKPILVKNKDDIVRRGKYLAYNQGTGKLYPVYSENDGDINCLHIFFNKGYLYKKP